MAKRYARGKLFLPRVFGEEMYLPLVVFAVFATILFGIGFAAGRAADRITLREEKERERRLDAA
jgi:hypothetical protein